MADRVELAFRRAALRFIPDEAPLLVAVSGGADSVALLHLLVRHSRTRSLSLTVAHLDHGLRRGSAADRRFVKQISADLSLDCLSDRRPVGELRQKDESPEEAARRVRRAFLMEAAGKVDAHRIATGHTMDDQAETVLMRLVRGAGPSALAGMAPSGPGPFVRPLLGIERADLREYLKRRGFQYREDPSNRNLRFDRNRVRRLILPLLSEKLNPRAARHLVEAAERLREDSAFLDGLAGSTYRRLRNLDSGKGLELPAHLLAEAPPPLARRIARLAIEEAGTDPRRIAARHIEAVLRLATGEGGKKMNLPGRHEALRFKDRLILR